MARWRERLRQHPWRVAGFVVGDPSMRHAFKARLGVHRSGPRPTAERELYAIGDWADLARSPG